MSGSNTPTSSITSPRDQSEDGTDAKGASWMSGGAGGSADNSFEDDDGRMSGGMGKFFTKVKLSLMISTLFEFPAKK